MIHPVLFKRLLHYRGSYKGFKNLQSFLEYERGQRKEMKYLFIRDDRDKMRSNCLQLDIF